MNTVTYEGKTFRQRPIYVAIRGEVRQQTVSPLQQKHGGLGAVLGIVAAIAIPFAAPAIAEALGVSSVLGVSSLAATAITGGVLGGGLAALEGQNPLVGAAGGALGSYGAAGGFSGAPGAVASDASASPSYFSGAGPTGAPAAAGLTGGAGGATVAGGADIGPSLGGLSGVPSTGAAPAGSFITGGSATSGLGDTAASTLGSATPTAFNSGASVQSLTGVAPAASSAAPAATTTLGDKLAAVPGKMAATLTNPDHLAQAGLNLGTTAIASALSPKPDMGPLNDYLAQTTAQAESANAFNMAQGAKKSAVGDQVLQSGQNINPGSTALDALAASNGRSASQWAQQEAQMRAQGYGQDAINAAKSTFDNQSNLAGTSAYDSGYTTGQTNQINTMQAAAGDYSGINVPTASNTSDYLNTINAGNNNAKAIGNGLTSAFGIDSSQNNSGVASTTKKTDPTQQQ